jgi:hypothetical protein
MNGKYPRGPADGIPGRVGSGVVLSGAARKSFLTVLLLFSLVSAAAGDLYGGRQPLWHRYFEAEPGNLQRYGRVEIPRENRERCRAVLDLFSEIGAREIVLSPSEEGAGEECPANIVVELDGEIPDAIIVSAHLDRAGSGRGAVDDFSGVVMQGMLYLYFKDRPHRHTLVFAVFDGEEVGQAGSRRFIEKNRWMPERITAVVNLECLGVMLPRSWAEGSSDRLEDILTRVGKKRGMDCGPVSIENVSADSIPFLRAGYPAITIEGIGPEHIGLLGTDWDRQSVVRGDILEATFTVLVDFLNTLDALMAAPNPAYER